MNTIIKSIFAGFLIGLAGLVYLTVQGPLGAFLFSVGLLGILSQGLKLYTGVAGDKIDWWLLVILLGNFLGTYLFSILTSFAYPDLVCNVVREGFLGTFLKGIGCGVLMSVAVRGYRKGIYWLPCLAITAFILSGFSHCIADSFYYFVMKDIKWIPWLASILGNLIGCNIPYKRWVKE